MNESIDVVLCTWNSNKTWFQSCLQSILRYVPVHHLIVVDRESTDGTVDAVRTLFPEAIIIESKENLGWARKIGAEQVDTECFAYIDDDVEIPEEWYGCISPLLTDEAGAVHALAFPANSPSLIEKWDRWLSKYQGNTGNTPHLLQERVIDVRWRDSRRYRGYTHNTIVRTMLIHDWMPPRETSAYEDWLLLRHITRKGLIWRILAEYIVKHYRSQNMKEQFQRTKWAAAGARLTGYSNKTLRQLLGRMILEIPAALLATLDYKDPQVFPYVIRRNFAVLDGYLSWEKNVGFDRSLLRSER